MYNLKTLESLAKISLTDEEEKTAEEFFDFFISKFALLENIDTETVEPLVTVFSLENIMREDTAYKMLSREKLFENSIENNDGYIVVPRILE